MIEGGVYQIAPLNWLYIECARKSARITEQNKSIDVNTRQKSCWIENSCLNHIGDVAIIVVFSRCIVFVCSVLFWSHFYISILLSPPFVVDIFRDVCCVQVRRIMGSLHLFVLDREKRKSAECDLSNYYVETMGIHDGWSLQVLSQTQHNQTSMCGQNHTVNITLPRLSWWVAQSPTWSDQSVWPFFSTMTVTNTIMNNTSTQSQSDEQDQP